MFQIKGFVGNIKKTALARYFVKVNALPSFTRLRAISRKKKEFIKSQNRKICWKDSVVSSSYLNLLAGRKY